MACDPLNDVFDHERIILDLTSRAMVDAGNVTRYVPWPSSVDASRFSGSSLESGVPCMDISDLIDLMERVPTASVDMHFRSQVESCGIRFMERARIIRTEHLSQDIRHLETDLLARNLIQPRDDVHIHTLHQSDASHAHAERIDPDLRCRIAKIYGIDYNYI